MISRGMKDKGCMRTGGFMSSRVLTVITQIMVMAVVISVVLLFIGIGILILIHLCIVGRAFRRSFTTRRSGVSSVSPPPFNMSNAVMINGMSLEEVGKLPSFEYNNKHAVGGGGERGVCSNDDDAERCGGGGKGVFDCTECAVCLDGFQLGERCRLLPVCRHSFHAKCVDTWLYKNPMCPICRTSVEDQEEEEDREEEEEEEEAGVPTGGNCDFANGIPVQGGGSAFFHVSQTPNSPHPLPPPPPLPPMSPRSSPDEGMRYAIV